MTGRNHILSCPVLNSEFGAVHIGFKEYLTPGCQKIRTHMAGVEIW
jgi:hypothetical protein